VIYAAVVLNDKSPSPHVTVVGAGIAGIICAQQLARFGCSVTLLEATVRDLLI
jgi:phytoene dehydrogenase-like protein